MSQFRFHLPITISYGDIDAQWHVNNKAFLSYIETARFQYLQEAHLFTGDSFLEVPFIVADVHVKYLYPIEYKDAVMVSMGITRIGNKSLRMEYAITSPDGSRIYATAETVLVTFDYHAKTSIPVNAEIRRRISEYEGRTF
jgi:YbgC/YbaW family acyl-CoA thioester hydrolase